MRHVAAWIHLPQLRWRTFKKAGPRRACGNGDAGRGRIVDEEWSRRKIVRSLRLWHRDEIPHEKPRVGSGEVESVLRRRAGIRNGCPASGLEVCAPFRAIGDSACTRRLNKGQDILSARNLSARQLTDAVFQRVEAECELCEV